MRSPEQHGGPGAHAAPGTGSEVEVTYLRGGKLQDGAGQELRPGLLDAVIPYLCPELPEAQRDALAYAVKVPLVYTNVLAAQLEGLRKLGVRSASCSGRVLPRPCASTCP